MKVGTWYQVPTKAKSSDFANPTKHLRDLVKMSIMAHRRNRGDIIWACWQPGGAGVAIGDVRRINSGTMLIMVTPNGADKIGEQLALGPGEGMRPWHFDLALKKWLCHPRVNEEARACYVFPPVGNYTTHISGCDIKNFGEGSKGRPDCWSEDWCCPGTSIEEDPQRRSKRFLCWNGDRKYFDVGSADVDKRIAGELEWRSFWQGEGAPPTFLAQEERRPHAAGGQLSEGKGYKGVEPSATSKGPHGATSKTQGTGKAKGRAPTIQDVLRAKGGPSGKGKDTAFSLRPDYLRAEQASLHRDSSEQLNNDDDGGKKSRQRSASKETSGLLC